MFKCSIPRYELELLKAINDLHCHHTGSSDLLSDEEARILFEDMELHLSEWKPPSHYPNYDYVVRHLLLEVCDEHKIWLNK